MPLGYHIRLDNPFADVKESDWFYDNVMFVYTHSLMIGTNTDPKLFSPNMITTRGMFVTILYRLDGYPDVNAFINPFTDNPSGAWYHDAAIWAASNNIDSGYGNDLFGAGDDITREQLATTLMNYIKFKGYALPGGQAEVFRDESDMSAWTLDAIRLLRVIGVIGGKPDNIYDPQGTATRAETAAIVTRFIKKI